MKILIFPIIYRRLHLLVGTGVVGGGGGKGRGFGRRPQKAAIYQAGSYVAGFTVKYRAKFFLLTTSSLNVFIDLFALNLDS